MRLSKFGELGEGGGGRVLDGKTTMDRDEEDDRGLEIGED